MVISWGGVAVVYSNIDFCMVIVSLQIHDILIFFAAVERLKITLQHVQGFSWTEVYFGHFVQAAPILFRHLEIFRTFF